MREEVRLKLKRKALIELQKLAERRGHTLEETLNHAINSEVYLDQRLRDGGTILCQDSEGELWRVVFSHMKTED